MLHTPREDWVSATRGFEQFGENNMSTAKGVSWNELENEKNCCMLHAFVEAFVFNHLDLDSTMGSKLAHRLSPCFTGVCLVSSRKSVMATDWGSDSRIVIHICWRDAPPLGETVRR